MKCFNHINVDSVGICKCCQRGICKECASDLGHGLACKGKHEADVELFSTLIERSKKKIELQPRAISAGNLSWLIMGIIFLGFGYYQQQYFLMVFGAFCAGYWLYLKAYNSNFFKNIGSQ